jgi:TRAP-type C4-dicarboxylate transport system permease small subunit
MKAAYVRAMDALYLACVILAGFCLVVMTIIIPVGVFFRYALNSALAWPEPAATIMMIYFSFLGGAAVYRANVHIAMVAIVDNVPANVRQLMLWTVHLCMIVTTLFMLIYGYYLVGTTWNQVIADFPWLRTGWTYLPIPLCGLFTLLFIVERIWVGEPPADSVMFSDQPTGGVE